MGGEQKMTMKAQEQISEDLCRQQAANRYPVCFAEKCPRREQCLRWLVGNHIPDTADVYVCVNLRYKDVATMQCPHFRTMEKKRYAKGMMHIFSDDMPQRVVSYVKNGIIRNHCQTYYYEYRNGSRAISPEVQQEILQLFKRAGWNEPVKFDSYFESIDW